MSQFGAVIDKASGKSILSHVQLCDSFLCKLRGLMFRRPLGEDEGLLMSELYPSRIATAIHMFFVGFPIAAIWLDRNFTVVDKVLAKPWHPFYAPSSPAKYTLEAVPGILDAVQIGDRLEFVLH